MLGRGQPVQDLLGPPAVWTRGRGGAWHVLCIHVPMGRHVRSGPYQEAVPFTKKHFATPKP